MPSRGNPNTPSKQRRLASRAKVQKRNAQKGITKVPRGTTKSNTLLPTSGPNAAISGKKAKKLQRALNHAQQRQAEQEQAIGVAGEVVMTDALKVKKTKSKKGDDEAQMMEIDV